MTESQAPQLTGGELFRIESDCDLQSQHWSGSNTKVLLVHDRSLAVAMAAKSLGTDCKGEVRVVFTPTGEVIFRKQN
jgi:hypothetical protein